MSEKNEWIEWSGCECPLPDNVYHEVKFEDVKIRRDSSPQTWAWGKEGGIIAYRIIEPKKPKEVVFDNLVNNFGETVRLPLPDTFNVKAKEPEPIFPLIAYNVYRGSEHLGVVEIPENLGGHEAKRAAHMALGTFTGYAYELNLHRIPIQRKYRLGKLI